MNCGIIMKTEKLFEEVSTCGFHGIKNTQTNKYYWGNNKKQVSELVDLLNRQNNQIITSNHRSRILKEDNNQLRILVESLKTENKKLKGRLTDLGVEYF